LKNRHINFITRDLAAPALARLLARCSFDFSYDIIVLPGQVAALMTTGWIARRLPENLAGAIMIPGGCKGALGEISNVTGTRATRGPVDLNGLPEHFGKTAAPVKYGQPRLKIVAEIVDAPTMSIRKIVALARYYRRVGADWVDLGCVNGIQFPHLDETVRELVRLGFNVSVDSSNPEELLAAGKAGAGLFLSVNSQNIYIAPKLDGKVVVIPDPGKGLASLYENAKNLDDMGVDYILDPILDPLCLGAAESIARYAATRRKFRNTPILMGVGNVSELAGVDNIGISAFLAGVCAELEIDYALTTEVARWNRDSVKQLSIARNIMESAVYERIAPKRFDNRLLVVRDADRPGLSSRQVKEIYAKIKDRNYRIFVAEGFIHVFNRDVYVKTKTVDDIFEKLRVDNPSHAFYLGRELQKAETALVLGKDYTQEKPLDWGYISGNKR